jgi:hypothetical protein
MTEPSDEVPLPAGALPVCEPRSKGMTVLDEALRSNRTARAGLPATP